jgi:hypothetical protein
MVKYLNYASILAHYVKNLQRFFGELTRLGVKLHLPHVRFCRGFAIYLPIFSEYKGWD